MLPTGAKSREAGKGVRGRAPIGCSIAVLTANRRPPGRSPVDGFRCPRQRHIKLPSEPARSVGRTHRSVRSTRTIEPGRRKAPEPSSPKGLVHKKSALRDSLSVSYGMTSILVMARCARLPLSRGRINLSTLSSRVLCALVFGPASHQKGALFPKGRLF